MIKKIILFILLINLSNQIYGFDLIDLFRSRLKKRDKKKSIKYNENKFFDIKIDRYKNLKEYNKITILYTTDINGRLFSSNPNTPNQGGFSRLASKIYKFREENSKTILLNTGNFTSVDSYISFFNRGNLEFSLLKMLDYDFSVIARNEFDFGIDNLFNNIKRSKLDIIVSNLEEQIKGGRYKTEKEKYIKSYKTFTFDGIKLGFFSIIDSNSFGKNREIFENEFKFNDLSISTQKTLYKLKFEEKCDFIVLVTNISENLEKVLAIKYKDIDLIISGNKVKSFKEDLVIKNSIIAPTDVNLNSLGKIDLIYKREKLFTTYTSLIPLDKTVEENKNIKNFLNFEKKQIDERLNKIIGLVKFKVDNTEHKKYETQLYNQFTKFISKNFNTDITSVSSDLIKKSIDYGYFRLKEIFNIIDFGQHFIRAEISGENIFKLIKYNERVLKNSDYYLHFNGIDLNHNLLLESKINGYYLDFKKKYSIVFNSNILNNKKIVKFFENSFTYDHKLMYNYFIDYLIEKFDFDWSYF